MPALLAGLALLLAGCGGGGGGGAGPLPASFRVLTSTPAAHSVNVARDQVITVRMTEGVQPSSVTSTSIVVTATGVGVIAGTASHIPSGDGSELRWTPSELFPGATDHVITVSADIASTSGQRLGTAATIPFRSAPDAPIGIPQAADLRAALGGLSVGRQSHRATLLQDGRVLVTGGFTQNSAVTDVAEVFDPTQDRFFTLGSVLGRGRAAHAQVLLPDGRVLICGGRYETAPGVFAVTDETEIFDPAFLSFQPSGRLNTGRYDHAIVVLEDGRVLVSGGTNSSRLDLDDAEVWNPATGEWSVFSGQMAARRATHAMVPFGPNRFLVLGGSVALYGELLDINAGTFTATNVPAQEGQRFGPVAANFASGAAILAGGDLGGRVVYALAGTPFLQNTGSNLWRPRSYATGTLIAPDRFFVAGGIDFQNDFFDGTCDIVIEGGPTGSRTFTTDVRFPTGMASHTATLLDNGNVMFCGGLNENGLLPNLRATYILEVD
ncbi:MAG: kelch repeat-containing protein [Planctomycetota bacterium]